MPNFNPYPLDLVNSKEYAKVNASAAKTAVATIATQLSTFRFAADVVACTRLLYDLIEDMVRCQVGQSPAPVMPAAAVAENLITDATTQTAMGTLRTYFAGIAAATTPAVGQLPLKNAFGPLAARIVEAI